MRQPLKEALRWSSQAEDDLRFVEWLAEEKTFFDKGCFISQQAGEKILKACLYALEDVNRVFKTARDFLDKMGKEKLK